MMHKPLFAILLTLAATIGYAQAQFPYRPNPNQRPLPYRPPVSPYLNLVRPNTSPAFNYNTLVRPQQQFQNSVQGLQNQIYNVQSNVLNTQQQLQQGLGVAAPTGVAAGFMTHRQYFKQYGGGAGGGIVP